MLLCHGLMLYVILRLFGQCLHDTLKDTPEEDHSEDHAETWASLSRLQQATKLFNLKQKYFASNKNFELSPELYKFCAKRSREPNKIRFGKYNKPKAHQSWVILRNRDDASEGTVYKLPLKSNQIETILENINVQG
jgi:hypothetical protein